MRNPKACVSDPNQFVTDPGSDEKIIYKTKVRPDGTLDIQPVGTESISAKIESFRPQTDMSFILKQIALGNYDALQVTPGQYGDFTQMPKTMAEALQMRIDAEDAWYKMDVEKRATFDHDINRWLATAGTDEWIQKMCPGQIKPADAEIPVEPVTPPDETR